MYVTAHRVETPAKDREATHAFLHLHGDEPWPDDVRSWPEDNPGELHSKKTVLPVGGNSVRAYLDVLAPDETGIDEIKQVLAEFRADLMERSNPTVLQRGRVTIRFGVELSLESEKDRSSTFDELAGAVVRLLKKRQPR